MVNYFKNLISELSVLEMYRKTSDDPSLNPILAWWRDIDYDRRLTDLVFKAPPSKSHPVTDDEVFVAVDILLNTDPVSTTPLEKAAGKRGRFLNYHDYPHSLPVLLVITTFVSLLSLLAEPLIGFGILASTVFILVCVTLPFMVPLNVVFRVKYTQMTMSPTVYILILGVVLYPVIVVALTLVLSLFSVYGVTLILIVLFLINTLFMFIARITGAFMIRYAKRVIDKRRMES